MKSESIKYKANYYALLLLAFVIPLERKLIAPAVILFLVTCLINLKQKFDTSKKLLFFGAIYLLYLLGMLYTNNTAVGVQDLMTKLPLMLLPIGFFMSSLTIEKIKSNVFTSFIDGCFVSLLIAFVHSGYQYFFTQDLGHFFYHKLALFAHPSYLAMLFTFSIALLYVGLLSPKRYHNESSPLKKLFLIGLFSIFTIMLLSKTGILTCLLVHLGALIYWVKSRRNYVVGALVLIATTGLMPLAFYGSSSIQSRLNEMSSVSAEYDEGLSSTSSRLSIWKISGELFTDKPLVGHGTGDVTDVLVQAYNDHEYTYLAEKKLNAHNQFIQTALAIGLIGAIVLILMLGFPLIWSLKRKNFVLLVFMLLVVINFATESMLERQVGVTFYALFNLLCLSEVKSEKD